MQCRNHLVRSMLRWPALSVLYRHQQLLHSVECREMERRREEGRERGWRRRSRGKREGERWGGGEEEEKEEEEKCAEEDDRRVRG